MQEPVSDAWDFPLAQQTLDVRVVPQDWRFGLRVRRRKCRRPPTPMVSLESVESQDLMRSAMVDMASIVEA